MKRLFKTTLTVFATVAFTSVALAGGSMVRTTKCTHAENAGIKDNTVAGTQVVRGNSSGSAGTAAGVH